MRFLKKRSSLQEEDDESEDSDSDDRSDDEESTGGAKTRSGRSVNPPEILTHKQFAAVPMANRIHKCFVQSFNLHSGLKEFGGKEGEEGYEATFKEIKQLHGRGGMSPTHLRDLTDLEAKRALEAVTILLRKKSGVVKARTCANGSVQRNWMSKEDVSSPTALTESVLLTSVIDAAENRFVATCDIPNAFIQADIEIKPGDPRVVMVVRGILVDMLVKIDPKLHTQFVHHYKGKKALYLIVHKAQYGMIFAPMLWFNKISADLKSHGFKVNPHDPCVANLKVNGHNLTVLWHVDDLKISHKDKKAIEDFVKWLDNKCSDKNGKLTVTWGLKHVHLGMTLDFSKPGAVKIDMVDYVKSMLKQFEEEVQSIGTGKDCPWSDKLFEVDSDSPKLDVKEAETFHTYVAKSLFLCMRARPDILTAVAFLCTRVQSCTEQDWQKLVRMFKFLKKTQEDVLTLSADNLSVLNWYWDASFAVHQDYKSHTGGALTMGKGTIAASSKKQKLNTRSSTEAELVAVDDGMSQMLWTKLFLEAQGYPIKENRLHQDNKSAILLEKNGKASSSKRTRHLNIRYFFVTDQVSKGNLKIEFCPTAEMIADYFTKPTTGSTFQRLRCLIMNLPQCEDTGEPS